MAETKAGLTIGIIAVQGAVSEHVDMTRRALEEMGHPGTPREVIVTEDLEGLDAVILPGGESTAISRLLTQRGLRGKLKEMVNAGLPIMGTCAGLILLAKEDASQQREKGLELLGLMDASIDRNAFGRQKESFETMLEIEGLDTEYHAVFIRGPVIKEARGECKPISMLADGKIVAAREGRMLALAFHPELSDDLRIHKMFFEMALSNIK